MEMQWQVRLYIILAFTVSRKGGIVVLRVSPEQRGWRATSAFAD